MNIMLDEGATMPTRAYENDAGLDLYARETQIVSARESAKFDTGVHIEIPPGVVGILKSKSGLNTNHDLVTDGVIDAGYTGSIMVKLYNLGGFDYKINKGEKIAQLVLFPFYIPDELNVVDRFKETDRGSNGFGSSGK